MPKDIELDEKGKKDPLEGDDKKKEESKLPNMTQEQLINYISDLRDENAKRRKQLRDQEGKSTDIEKQLEETKSKLDEANKALGEVKSKEEEAKKAEMAEIDRLKAETMELQKKLESTEQESTEKDKTIKSLVKKQTESSLVNLAMALLNKSNFKFRSKVEERGFKAEVLEMKDGKYKNENEIEDFISEFLKENAQAEPGNENDDLPEPAPGGPKVRKKGAPTDQDRLLELMNKEPLTKEERDEMVLLAEKIENSVQG